MNAIPQAMPPPEILDDAADRLENWIGVATAMSGDSTFVSSEVIRMFGYLLGINIARELVKVLRNAQDRHTCHRDLCMWCSDDLNDIPWPCGDVQPLLRIATFIMENLHV